MPDEKNKSAAGTPPLRPTVPTGRDTGAALRSVYQKTVDEAVPDEMLDLLGKLD